MRLARGVGVERAALIDGPAGRSKSRGEGYAGAMATLRFQGCFLGLALAFLAGSVRAQGLPATQIPPSRLVRRPFPQHVTYAPGTILPNHVGQSQLDSDVVALYDAWKQRYLAQAGSEPDGHPRYRVRTGRHPSDPTVSEGMGYGMLLSVYLAGADPEAQTIFDGLYEFVLDHPSEIDPRLMDWHVAANEVPDGNGNDSAFDGDADIAYALLLASRQWGNGGRFNYYAEALHVLGGVRQSTLGPTSFLPLLGDWVSPNGATYNEYTARTSDFMFDHWRAFEAATGDSSWASAYAACRSALDSIETSFSPQTALQPDFIVPLSQSDTTPVPAPPFFLEAETDGDYSYNAVRFPWRVGTEAVLTGDPSAVQRMQRLTTWIEGHTGGNPQLIRAGYALDGGNLSGTNYFTTLFAATFAVAAMSDPNQQAWLNQAYQAVHASDEDYFEDSVTLLCMLVLSGNYWEPY